VALWVSGQTVNIMTLGGLALAVGILVDEATVTIENVHTHLARGRSLARSARDATSETTVPRFLAMLCILAVFIPAFFMTGAARSLFVPLSLAVGFSMVASYLLSSTFVPVVSIWALGTASTQDHPREPFFYRLRHRYEGLARSVIERWRAVVSAYLVISGAIIVVIGGSLGTEIFPVVDVGQFQLHLRAQPGTRIERTEQIALQALDAVKREISLGFVGTQPPNYPINTIYLWSSGSEEALLQIQLKRNSGIHVEDLKEQLRRKLPEELPGVRFTFEPSDIISRVMSFGAPTPIEVAVSGRNLAETRQYAEKLRGTLAQVPMLRDLVSSRSSNIRP
jgi:multidrug efflux pump subunit AcrB